jgi:hypothetical protein
VNKFLFVPLPALALFAGAALAGNDSTVEQIGEQDRATVDQWLGGGASNASTIYQNSNANFANLNQIGAANSEISSTITQNDGVQGAFVRQNATHAADSARLTSTISQENSMNDVWLWQTANASTVSQISTITQKGLSGTVRVTQYGPNDSSVVTQGGEYNNEGYGLVHVGFGWWVYGGVGIVQQGSTSNTSTVTQDGSWGGVYVAQDGTAGHNTSTATQDASSSWSYAGVVQFATGGDNNSTIAQGAGFLNRAAVYQH